MTKKGFCLLPRGQRAKAQRLSVFSPHWEELGMARQTQRAEGGVVALGATESDAFSLRVCVCVFVCIV